MVENRSQVAAIYERAAPLAAEEVLCFRHVDRLARLRINPHALALAALSHGIEGLRGRYRQIITTLCQGKWFSAAGLATGGFGIRASRDYAKISQPKLRSGRYPGRDWIEILDRGFD